MPTSATHLSRFWNSTGYRILSVADGVTALAALKETRFDFAIFDIGLPGMDGYELARRVRANSEWTSTRLIALTGYGQPLDIVESRRAGFDAHLTKPFDPEALKEILTRA